MWVFEEKSVTVCPSGKSRVKVLMNLFSAWLLQAPAVDGDNLERKTAFLTFCIRNGGAAAASEYLTHAVIICYYQDFFVIGD